MKHQNGFVPDHNQAGRLEMRSDAPRCNTLKQEVSSVEPKGDSVNATTFIISQKLLLVLPGAPSSPATTVSSSCNDSGGRQRNSELPEMPPKKRMKLLLPVPEKRAKFQIILF